VQIVDETGREQLAPERAAAEDPPHCRRPAF
jgi:hypothetical protein